MVQIRSCNYACRYSYTFPFLDTKGMVAVDDDRVGPLHEHTFPLLFPLTVPSWDQMMRSIEEFYSSRDTAAIPRHSTHEWRKILCLSALVNADAILEACRDSLDDH
uniref:Uncharacterized protein n=1 Tax=Populus trichocarpa TaxID=3694 RepID=A0A2K1Y9Y8_POPTR